MNYLDQFLFRKKNKYEYATRVEICVGKEINKSSALGNNGTETCFIVFVAACLAGIENLENEIKNQDRPATTTRRGQRSLPC